MKKFISSRSRFTTQNCVTDAFLSRLYATWASTSRRFCTALRFTQRNVGTLPYSREISYDVMNIETSHLNFAPPLALLMAHEGNVVVAINVTEANISS